MRHKIHEEREQRKRDIAALQYECVINKALAQRLSSLIMSLKSETANKTSARDPTEIAFDIVTQSALQEGASYDTPPPPSRDVFEDSPITTYSEMILGLLDNVKETLKKRNVDESHRCDATFEELAAHLTRIETLQTDLNMRLDTLQADDAKKITSASYRTGFDSSHVNNAAASGSGQASAAELLNPESNLQDAPNNGESTTPPEEEEPMQATPTGIAFGEITPSDFRASHDYILSHPEVLREQEVDGLLVEAYNAAVRDGNSAKARQYVHQATIIQFCRVLGRDRLAGFFRSLAIPGHRVPEFIHKDTDDKLKRILELAEAEREAVFEGTQQIQIGAADPGYELHISAPDVGSEARTVFDGFAPDMQAALESGSLDQLNEVLGKMNVADAENLLGRLGEAHCLHIEVEARTAPFNDVDDHIETIP